MKAIKITAAHFSKYNSNKTHTNTRKQAVWYAPRGGGAAGVKTVKIAYKFAFRYPEGDAIKTKESKAAEITLHLV